MTLHQEVYRKLVHLSSLWIVVVYYKYGFAVISTLLTISIVVMLVFEFYRAHDSRFGETARTFMKKTGIDNVIRLHESKDFTGATKLIMASFVTLYIMPQHLYLVSISTLVIADSAAAIVGRKYGTKVICGKTIEGSVAFLISSMMIAFFWKAVLGESDSFLFFAIVASGIATIAEFFARKINIDDNALVPFVYAVVAMLQKIAS